MCGFVCVLCCTVACLQRKYCFKGEEGRPSQEAVLGAGSQESLSSAPQSGAPPAPLRKRSARDYQQVTSLPLKL